MIKLYEVDKDSKLRPPPKKSGAKLYTVTGNNYDECIKNLTKFLTKHGLSDEYFQD